MVHHHTTLEEQCAHHERSVDGQKGLLVGHDTYFTSAGRGSRGFGHHNNIISYLC